MAAADEDGGAASTENSPVCGAVSTPAASKAGVAAGRTVTYPAGSSAPVVTAAFKTPAETAFFRESWGCSIFSVPVPSVIGTAEGVDATEAESSTPDAGSTNTGFPAAVGDKPEATPIGISPVCDGLSTPAGFGAGVAEDEAFTRVPD